MALIEVALTAVRTKGSAFVARDRRVMRQHGAKKAVVAVAHSLTIYHGTGEDIDYRESGAEYFDGMRATPRVAVAQLERLSYRVTLEPAA
jgi:transposase